MSKTENKILDYGEYCDKYSETTDRIFLDYQEYLIDLLTPHNEDLIKKLFEEACDEFDLEDILDWVKCFYYSCGRKYQEEVNNE